MAECMPDGEFAMVPNELLKAPVSAMAIRLWAVLDRHQRVNGDAWPGRTHLAEHLGCSKAMVTKAINELVDPDNGGWLEVQPGGGRGRTNRYVVLGRPRSYPQGSPAGPFPPVNGHDGDRLPGEHPERVTRVTSKGHTRDPEERTREEITGGTQQPKVPTARAKRRNRPDICPHGVLIENDAECPICSAAGRRKAGAP